MTPLSAHDLAEALREESTNVGTIIVHTWRGKNPFNYASYPVHRQGYTPALAMRLARILTGENGIVRSQVVHARWEGAIPFLTRVDIDADGKEKTRIGNYIALRKGGIGLDPDHPYTEVAS